MTTYRRITNRLWSAFGPALLICTLIFYGYHMLEGKHGLLALRAYEQAIPELELKAADLRAKRHALEHHVALLDPQHIDPDYLEELVRERLGFVHPNDIILPLPETAGQ